MKNVRTCKGCFKKYDKTKHEMIAVSYNKKNKKYELFEDAISKKQGLGKTLYICKNSKCIRNVIRGNRIQGFFKQKLDDDIIEKLEQIILKLEENI